ncbi:hypothetical protein BDF19DRAFT_242364 [Syncephalis fuscata]|nr:hypothetical protein BDF19DRAFT_242364 [Syncephalis fuscata]
MYYVLDMLLVIDFLLLPDKDTRLRGIFSILILLALVCYNIRMRPCYVRPINYWRTASLCCILWTALLVPIINDEKLDLNINVAGTVSLIVVGWVVIVLFFFFVRYCYRAEPYDPELEAQTDTDSTNPSHLPPHKRLVTAVSSFQSLLTGRSSQRSSAVDLLNGRQAKHRRSTTDHHKQSTSNNFLNVESALERAMSRARPPPWKDPWAPLPPYYRQYQASSRRRRYNAERRAPIGIPNTPNYLSIRVNGSTGLFPHDISNQRRARTEVNGIYEDSEDEVVEGSRVMEDPTWATLHPNYQARMSMPDIPTFIIQQQEQEQQQQQQQQQQTVASQPIMAMPEPYDGHGPPMSTVLGGHSSTEPWPSDITEETVYLSENQQVYNTTLDTPSTATPLLGSMNMPSATLHRQQILQATQQQSSGRPLGRSRSRSMPGPPTWLNDLNELSRVTERTENPDDTINNSSTIHNSSTIYNSSNILLL